MKLYRDPLLHFALAGALLFAGYSLVNRGETNASATNPVHISQGDVRWLKETFADQWQRSPTDDELRGLVAGFLEEQLFAREAKTLGLDQDDTIVRRRLAQKLAFLVDDTSRAVEPSDEECGNSTTQTPSTSALNPACPLRKFSSTLSDAGTQKQTPRPRWC